ncbi:MAG: hypothetical protein WCY71_08740 [Halothiobacillaceae bacterium]
MAKKKTEVARLGYRQSTLAAALDTTRQTIRTLELRGDLPPRIEISPGLKIWPASVIDQWLAERAAHTSKEEGKA